MTTYRPYPRRTYRLLFNRWARRNLRTVVVVTGGMVLLFALGTLVITRLLPTTALTWWALGALQIGLVGIYLHLLSAAFLAHDGEAIWQLRGAWGEENTRDELRRAERRGLIWGRVDSITLQVGDLDHVVVTRNGGLVAIDSKWRNQPTDTEEMARDARRMKVRAEALVASLLRSERAVRHRSGVNPLEVTPVVVLWGAAQHGVPEGAQVAGIEFVAGRQLGAWLRQLDGRPVDSSSAADVLARLRDFRATAMTHAQGRTS